MIQIRNASLAFGSQTIFDELSCTINKKDRIGLVGCNGSGKSTLLRVILGLQPIDNGTVQKVGQPTIGYMPQEITLASKKSILDEAVSNCHFDEMSKLAIRAEAKKILMGLGFSIKQFEQPVSSLSVGWKMRILLTKLLLQKADFYLLDEPINHLDLIAKEWFLDFLTDASFGFVLICHDRYFLDQLCAQIFEIEHYKCPKYNGNYTEYEKQKKHKLTILQAAYDNQQKDIARKQRTIDRFRAKSSKARMVKKMERDLEKIERIVLPSSEKSIHFSFPITKKSGKFVLEVNNLGYSFDTKKIFKNINFTLQRKNRMAIIAPNGRGKTTLFNIISGKYTTTEGSFIFGHNVSLSYFEQDQMQSLDLEKTIFENVSEHTTKLHPQLIKNMLGCFLFSQDHINKKVKVLSGGEKNRVSMVITLLQQANFLMLDEPTNHLDIQSKDILLQALKAYEGTILFVSHDHNFVNELATSILELNHDCIYHYHGNYEEYLYQKKQMQTKIPLQSTNKRPKEKNTHQIAFEKKKTIKRLEGKIKRLEKQIDQLSEQLETYSYGSQQFSKLYDKLQFAQKELTEKLKEWEEQISSFFFT